MLDDNNEKRQDRRERLAWRVVLAIACIALGAVLATNPARLRQRLEGEARSVIAEFYAVMRGYAQDLDAQNAPDPTQAARTPSPAATPTDQRTLVGVLDRYLDVQWWLSQARPTDEPGAAPTSAPVVYDPPTPAPTALILRSVSPVLVKVQDNNDGTYTAVFSYDNPNKCTVTIPVGSQNFISPDPADRGQETEFHPTGSLSAPPQAFAVVFKEESITWTLMGRSVTATVYE